MSTDRAEWDVEAGVVVLGSGGGALIAALSAHHQGATDVVVLEKSGMVGGTTAMSGGLLWIPLNPDGPRRHASAIRLPVRAGGGKRAVMSAEGRRSDRAGIGSGSVSVRTMVHDRTSSS